MLQAERYILAFSLSHAGWKIKEKVLNRSGFFVVPDGICATSGFVYQMNWYAFLQFRPEDAPCFFNSLPR